MYYRDESLTFYPFPTLTKGQVSSFSSSQQDTDQYGAKLTLNSQPLAGVGSHRGLDADHETFNANQMFFDLPQSMASGGLHNESIYTTGRYPGYSISNVAPFLQSSYDLNDIFTVSGGYATSGPKTGSTTLSATPSSRISPTAKRAPPTPSKAAKPIMTISCLTPGSWPT